MKKLLSAVVAMMLVLAMAVSAFAAEPPKGEVVFTANGPKTETNWWFDGWLDNDQKLELSTAIANGATHLVVAFEGEMVLSAESGAGFQVGFQDNVNWDAGYGNALWHSNFAAGEGQIGAQDAIEIADGISYVYLSLQMAKDYMAAHEFGIDLTTGTGYKFIIGAPAEYPLVALYAVNAPEVTAPAVEEPAPEEPADEPAVEPADEPEVEAEDTPADTGLTLAVLPAVIALAVVAFKKR